MLDLNNINYIAVIVVWIFYCVVGAIWYSPMGFAKLWEKYTGIDIMQLPKNDANKAIIFVVLSSLLQVFSLAIILNSLGVKDITNGIMIGLLLWLGFTAATTVGVTFYSKRSWNFLLLNSAYFLVVMSVGSIILSIWK